MAYTLVLWAFLYGVGSHATQGAGAAVTTFKYSSLSECEESRKKAQIEGKVGSDPFANYQVVGQCIAHRQ